MSADAVAGIPVDSEYIIFVIDTSNSMINYNWGLVQRKLQEALEAGSVSWDAELFTGKPEWQRLLNMPRPRLSACR